MATSIKVKRSAVAGRIPSISDLQLGEIAINTYDGIAYIKKNVSGGESVVPIGVNQSLQNRYQYTATAGQTTFTASYTAPYIDVYLNGIRLVAAVDYTATNGTSVVLANAASANNIIDIVAYNSVTVEIGYANLTSTHVTTALGYNPYNASNPSGFISGITSTNVITALGYTPYNGSTNPNGYVNSSVVPTFGQLYFYSSF
jgi:hypothetical protein